MRDVLARIIEGDGDALPVSAMPNRRNLPHRHGAVGKAQHRTGNPRLGREPLHPVRQVRARLPARGDSSEDLRAGACWKRLPRRSNPPLPRWKEFKQFKYTLQVAPEDCTGCALCVEICPVKSKSEAKHKAINMADQVPLRETERQNWDFFLEIPEADRRTLSMGQVKDVQLLQPLFEFSGACAGCGETPYIKLMTQLFGDRALIGNATGCSSIYGGNLPTTPYAVNHEGRGPTWSNSLFEDNAEFALGMRLAVDQQTQYARELVQRLCAQHWATNWCKACSTPTNPLKPVFASSAIGSKSLRPSWRDYSTLGSARPVDRRRRAGQEERLGLRRRRLGL